MDDVIIVGGGIGGLTLALMLHARGMGVRVYEAAPEIEPIGVGISLLPHAGKELGLLGLLDALTEVAVTTRDSASSTGSVSSCTRSPSAATPATTGRSSRYTGETFNRCSAVPSSIGCPMAPSGC